MNNKIVRLTGFNFLFLFIVLFSFQSCIPTRNRSIKQWEKQEWKVIKTDKKEKPTWVIHRREISGTNVIEYKIEGEIKSNPITCMKSFKQDLLDDMTDSKKFSTYNIIEESNDSFLTYVVHNEPFPFKDTEMSVRYRYSKSEDASTGVEWREAWDDCRIEPSKKLNRVQVFRGSWLFSPIYKNFSKAVNSIQFDPKKMPRWIFEPMVFKFLKEGLEGIRNMTSE